jgi:uridine kinase
VPSSADANPTTDGLTAALRNGADRVADAAARAGGIRAIILIDGRSGAGKSTFADLVALRLPGSAIIRLDDVYPGWDGLRAGAETVRTDVLEPLRRGEAGEWPLWDWVSDAPSGRRGRCDPAPFVIVEGAGVLTEASAWLADVTVWLDAPSDARKERALARDGDTFRPHWERWAEQEETHLREHAPATRAGIIVALP